MGVAGSTGTVLATLLLFPLERIKTLLMVGPDSRTVASVCRRLLREGGFRTLYQGCLPTLETAGTSNFIYFFLFEGFKDWLSVALRSPEMGSHEILLASAIAGSLNMLITEPLWRACVVAQARSSSSPIFGDGKPAKCVGVFGTVLQLREAEGLAALWRGLGSSLWLVVNPVIQFFMYDFLREMRTNALGEVSSLEAFILGATAKALATVATFPLQVAQSKLRAHESQDVVPEVRGMVSCLRALVRERGVLALYSGLLPKLLQTVTYAAFMFTFYEKVHWVIKRLFRRHLIRKGARRRAQRGLH